MTHQIEIFPWNDNFATGIEAIDVQHRKLIDLLNVLVRHLALQSEAPQLDSIIEELKQYAAHHFATEEAIWHKHFQGDPWELWHQRAHTNFVEKVIQMHQEKDNKPFDEVIEGIVTFLTHWLALHIIESDKRMAKVVLAFPSGCSLEQAKKIADDAMSGATRTLIETVMTMYDKLANHTVRMTREINRRKEAEVALRQAHRELQAAKEEAMRANQAKSDYLTMMSHEIRTPMQGVLGAAEILTFDDLDTEQRKECGRIILSSGKSLIGLVDGILDHARIEAGKVKLNPDACDPAQLMRDVCALFAPTAIAKGLTIDNHWQGQAGQRYRLDSARVQQMLSNLISNAIKFTTEGSITVEAFETHRHGAKAVLNFAVADTGIGIQPELQERLFKRFEQGEEAKQSRLGSGLGLSIVRSLAELMGGSVSVESQPGQGSRFRFWVQTDCV